jgi:3',5'-cyclic AMP phosphodiesterase CpdA
MTNASAAKKIMSVLLAVCILLTVAPISLAKQIKGNSGELLLATVSDIHYYPSTLAKYKSDAFYTYLQGANISYEDIDSIVDAAFASLARDAKDKGLKYVVLNGDLTTNGEYEGHVKLAEKLHKLEKESGLQVFVTNGNHDINNSKASQFTTENGLKTAARTTTPQEFYEIYKDFGFSDAYHQFKDFTSGEDGALSYSQKLDGGYRLIVADGGKYTHYNTESGEDEHETAGCFSDELLSWIISEAKDAVDNNETPLLVTHWNMSGINYMHEYLLQGFVIDEAYKLQETLADNGINYTFSGHQHVSDIDITYSDSGEPMYSIITPTLTQFPFAYRETKFERDGDGTINATFDMIDCDDAQQIANGDTNIPYAKTYRETAGFNKQMGNGDGAEYLLRMFKNMLGDTISDIQKKGSIVSYIEEKLDIDIRDTLNNLINGAADNITTGNEAVNAVLEKLKPNIKVFISSVRTQISKEMPFEVVDTIMNFLGDIDEQIMTQYINKPAELYSKLKTLFGEILSMQMSDLPCTKFIDTYGFGDETEPGTLEDVFFSVLVYMYVGNEEDNISDDLFMQDVLKNVGSGEIIDRLFDVVLEKAVDNLVVDDILSNIIIHLDSFSSADEEVKYVLGFIQLFFFLTVSAYDAYNDLDIDTTEFSYSDMLLNFGSFIEKFTEKIHSNKTISIANIAKLVLETGKIKYGSSVDEVAKFFYDKYIGTSGKEAMAQQLQTLLNDILYDEDRDWDVTYTYSGAVKVAPTVDDKQLPSDITVMQGKSETEYRLSWLTKYSVTGTDIEIVEENADFTGTPTTTGVEASSEETTYGGYGYDFGNFGILPWTRDGVRHYITVSGLKENTTYKYRIGDASKGFWSEECTLKTGGDSNGSFIFMTDIAGTTKVDYSSWADTLNAARAKAKNAEMLLLGGDSVTISGNDDQWNMALNSARDTLTSLSVAYAAGDRDICEAGAMRYFNAAFETEETDENKTGGYYSFDRDDIHFVVLNTNDKNSDGTLSSAQCNWLNLDLKLNSTAQWTVILMHASCYDENGNVTNLGKQLNEYATKYGVDLVLSSGSGTYARTKIINNGTATANAETTTVKANSKTYTALVDPNGTVYINGGNGGSTAGNENVTKADIFESVSGGKNMFTLIRTSDGTLTIDTYEVIDGKTTVVDSYAIYNNRLKALRGDVDQDGKVSVKDARLALRAVVRLDSPSAFERVLIDVDDSHSIDVYDARSILRVAIKLDNYDSNKYIVCTKNQLSKLDF